MRVYICAWGCMCGVCVLNYLLKKCMSSCHIGNLIVQFIVHIVSLLHCHQAYKEEAGVCHQHSEETGATTTLLVHR